MQISIEVIVGFFLSMGGGVVAWLGKRAIEDLDGKLVSIGDRLDDVEGDVDNLRRDIAAGEKQQARVEERLRNIEQMIADMRSDLKQALGRRGHAQSSS